MMQVLQLTPEQLNFERIVRAQAFDYVSEVQKGNPEQIIKLEDITNFHPKLPNQRSIKINLWAHQGIFTPAHLDLPISLISKVKSPYDDKFIPGQDTISYKYFRDDIHHRMNVGMRGLYRYQLPCLYLHEITPAHYLPAFPTYITADRPENLEVSLQIGEFQREILVEEQNEMYDRPLIPRYTTSIFKQRTHQATFRSRVMKAYRNACCICRLDQPVLLDAAHIKPDSEGGDPQVTNGLSLCKIHHSAYDSNILGISPNYQVQIREDILNHQDGPMLQHGLKEMDGCIINLPSNKNLAPAQEALSYRFDQFKSF